MWYPAYRASLVMPGVKPWEWEGHEDWMYRVLSVEGVEAEAAEAAKPKKHADDTPPGGQADDRQGSFQTTMNSGPVREITGPPPAQPE